MIRLVSCTAVLACALVSVAHADDTFRRTLPVGSQSDLYVSTGSGNIRIFPGNGNQIEVVGHVHAGWGAFGDVRSRIQRIVDAPPVTQSGNTVKVGEASDRSLFNNISIDYEVRVPADVALNLRSGSGDIEVDHVGRYLGASTGSGNLRAHGIHGAASIESGSGDLEIEDTGAGDVKARAGSGNVRIHGFNGSLQARTGSGDIEGDGRLEGQSMLSSGSGNVRLHLTPDSRFNFEGATGSGNIRVHMPGVTQTDSDSSRHHLTMGVNGGGPALQVRTGSGDIEIVSR